MNIIEKKIAERRKKIRPSKFLQGGMYGLYVIFLSVLLGFILFLSIYGSVFGFRSFSGVFFWMRFKNFVFLNLEWKFQCIIDFFLCFFLKKVHSFERNFVLRVSSGISSYLIRQP